MATKDTINHVIDTKHVGTTGCASFNVIYDIGPFSIRLNMSHNFWTQSTSMHAFTVEHTHFVVATRCLREVQINRYRVLLSLVRVKQENRFGVQFLNNIRIKRAFWLNVDTIFDEKDRAYTLKISFEDAPSLLKDKTISIDNVMDEATLLKQTVSRTVSEEYGIYIVDGIISMIFDEFLSKFQWSFPEKQILYSPLLGPESVHSLYDLCPVPVPEPDPYLHSNHPFRPFTWYRMLRRDGEQLHVKCVAHDNLDKAIQCNVSGIGINIEIHDPSITATNYPKLFELFSDFEIDTDSLSTIWTDITKERLMKLKNLHFHVCLHCSDRYSQIDVQVRLLLDTNVQDDDIAMILTEWKSAHNEGFDTLFFADSCDRGSNSTVMEIEDILETAGDWIQRENVDLFLSVAQLYVHYNFEKTVTFWEQMLLRTIPVMKVMDTIYGDMTHFGEPIIALQRLCRHDDVDRVIGNLCGLSMSMETDSIPSTEKSKGRKLSQSTFEEAMECTKDTEI